MKSATIHMDDAGAHPKDIEIDGNKFPLDAFLLLTSVPASPPAGHILGYGNSDVVGRMLFNYWKNCVLHDPASALVVEMVARDIVSNCEVARRPMLFMVPPETVQ